MATSFAVRKGRKHKMRLMREKEDQMVVKSLSVPPGLEALMEGLTREVLRMQPQDICLFASEHFAKLIKMREAAGGRCIYLIVQYFGNFSMTFVLYQDAQSRFN